MSSLNAENSFFSILSPGDPLKTSSGVRTRPLAITVKERITLIVLFVNSQIWTAHLPTILLSVLFALNVKGTGVWSMLIMYSCD
jgi:hypothetical protein